MTPCTILENRVLGPKGRLLRLEWQGSFIPGQVIGLAVNRDATPRWYSIASSPEEEGLSILYTLVEDGELTPRLFDLVPGSTIYLQEPRGQFVEQAAWVRNPASTIWWIANGTGIAPFVSMLRSGIQGSHRLVHGARTIEEAWFREECQARASENKDLFSYHLCLSQGKNGRGQGIHESRLTSWLQSEGTRLCKAQDHYMLCGSAGMIVEVREILGSIGIKHESISSEIYF